MREMGAGSVVITYRYGCVAELADGEGSRTFVGQMPDGGRGVAAWLGRRSGGRLLPCACSEGDSPAECLRFGLGVRSRQPDRLRSRRVLAGRRGEARRAVWNWRRCLLKA